MLRTIIGFAFAAIYLIGTLPVLLIEKIREKKDPKASSLRCLRMVQWSFRVILKICGVKEKVIGYENIPKDQAVLYVANHRSWFDILVAYSKMPNLTGFIAKESIQNVPILKTWMKKLSCLFMSKDMKAALKCIMESVNLIKDGISVFIFPEGTRNSTYDPLLLEFKEGSLKAAQRTGCAIIPVAIEGTREVFEEALPKVCPGNVTIRFGEPIYASQLEGDDKKHLAAYARGKILAMLEENK